MASEKFYKDYRHEWVKKSIFEDITARELFDLVLQKKQVDSSAGAPWAWVFDLDSTLFCVSHRIRSIFSEFLREHPRPRQRWHWLLEHLRPEAHHYGIEETFRHLYRGLDSSHAAEWAAELWSEFQDFWSLSFFSNRFLHQDAPYAGAVDFVHKIHNQNFEIVYLTGRDRPGTAEGTLRSLRMNGFPLSNRTHLYMKPKKEHPDMEFKKELCELLKSRFRVLATIDNEAENLVMFAESLPKTEIVFFHSIMSPRVPPHCFHEVMTSGRRAWRLHSFL